MCPGARSAMHVNTDILWNRSIDGTAGGAVISEGVCCISDDVDFGSAVFFICAGTFI